MGDNKIVSFDGDLEIVDTYAFQKEIFLKDMAYFNDKCYVVGIKTYLSIEGFANYGMLLELPVSDVIPYSDINISLDSIQYTIDDYRFSVYQYINYSDVTFFVTNRGNTPIDFFEINHNNIYPLVYDSPEFCERIDFQIVFENDVIMPNEQRAIHVPSVYIAGFRSQRVCFWAVAPNHQLDLNPNNDLKCIIADNGISSIKDFNVRLYPNPTVNLLNIQLPVHLNERLNAKIYNAQGKLIQEENIFPSPPPQQEHTIDVSQLSTGVYFLVLEENDGFIQTKRFVKMEY